MIPRAVILMGGAGIALVALASAARLDVLLYNGTPSMPVGLYLRTSDSIARGAIVTVRAAAVAPDYAARRGFADPGDRFLKRVVGGPGDEVCASGAEVTLNGAPVALRRRADSAGHGLERWDGCLILDDAHVFLLGATPDSFDGRYWGPTPVDHVEGVWRKL